MVDTLKIRQREARLNVSRAIDFSNNKPTGWIVKCLGSCGDNIDFHTVMLNRSTNIWSCDCPGNLLGDHVCVHIMTVYENEMRKIHFAPSFFRTNEQVQKQHRKTFAIQTIAHRMLGVMRKI